MNVEERGAGSSFIVHRSSFNVVVVTPDAVGERMAGPGIRATYLARELGKHFPTTLIAHGVGQTLLSVQDSTGRSACATPARDAIRNADVLIGQPVRGFFKRRPGQRMVYDL